MINEGGGTDSFSDTLSSVSEIRLRFENAQEANVQQFAFIDSLTVVPEPSSTVMLIGLSGIGIVLYFRRIK